MLHDLIIKTENEFIAPEYFQVTFRIVGETVDRLIAEFPEEEFIKRMMGKFSDCDTVLAWEESDCTCAEYLIDRCYTLIELESDGLHVSMLVPSELTEEERVDGTIDELPLKDGFWARPASVIRAILAK